MAEVLPATDVVVVGAGAAGALVAHRLVGEGFAVVCLEAGDWIDGRTTRLDEFAYERQNFFGAKANAEIPTWRPDAGSEASTSTSGRAVSMIANGVGGSSVVYGAAHLRMTPWDFRMPSNVRERYGADALPADCTAIDWPVHYSDLSPWYDEVEKLLTVSGLAGNLDGLVQPGGNPYEGPRAGSFPTPPLRRSGWNSLMAAAGSQRGWHPFPAPAAIDSTTCTYCGFCVGSACRVDAKGDTATRVIPLALDDGLVLRTGCRVTRILTDDRGRLRGVEYLDEGRLYVQPAERVVLAAHSWENVRLLLASRSEAFPQGLSNNHGQVGRNLMTHVYAGASGVFPGMDLARFNGSIAQATCFDDLNSDNFDHTGLGFVGGGVISAVQEQHPIAAALNTPPGVPRWGADWLNWVRENARSVGTLTAPLETLPYDDSLVDLDPERVDGDGLPVLRVTYRLHEQERRRWDHFTGALQQLLLDAGASQAWATTKFLPGVPFPSVFGVTRMGESAENSVVDSFGMSHEVPGLAICGSGLFPTSSGYNPTATVQALALRTAARIGEGR
jgi:gluconate 2-dehydrogenase alpha chain